jgi:hypothetical protein
VKTTYKRSADIRTNYQDIGQILWCWLYYSRIAAISSNSNSGRISQNNCAIWQIYYSSRCEKQMAMLTWQVCAREETPSIGWWDVIQIQGSMASIRWYVLLVGLHQSQEVCKCIIKFKLRSCDSIRNNQQMQLYAVNFIPLLSSLYMFRAAHTPIIRSTKFNCIYSHWYNHRLA